MFGPNTHAIFTAILIVVCTNKLLYVLYYYVIASEINHTEYMLCNFFFLTNFTVTIKQHTRYMPTFHKTFNVKNTVLITNLC